MRFSFIDGVGPQGQPTRTIHDNTLNRNVGLVARRSGDKQAYFFFNGIMPDTTALDHEALKFILDNFEDSPKSQGDENSFSTIFSVAPLSTKGCDPGVLFMPDRRIVINTLVPGVEVFCPACEERFGLSIDEGENPIRIEDE